MRAFYGAEFQLEKLIKTHLFLVIPNNSGSTFLKNALATSLNTWNLDREGQHMYGFVGPRSSSLSSLLWCTRMDWIATHSNKKNFDWEQTKKAWYFQSFSCNPKANIFVEKTPPSVLRVAQLKEHFHNARFIFMVRNPYAVIEGIYRREKNRLGEQALTLAAQHLINCLNHQRNNIKQFSDCSTFFRYEGMCAEPEAVQNQIKQLVPEISDLTLRQKIPSKSMYNETLRNMNADQIKRLSNMDIKKINKVFLPHKALLNYFDYQIIEKSLRSKD